MDILALFHLYPGNKENMIQTARRTYSEKNIKQLTRFEKFYVPKIFKALRSQVNEFVTIMQDSGLQAAQSKLHVTIINESMTKTLKDLHIKSGLFFARKGYGEIIRSTKQVEKAGFGFNETWTQDIINYFAQELFGTVSNITDTTREQIQQVLTQALNEQQGIDWISKQLQSPDLLIWRARLIARTELVKGSFIGRKLANQSSEWETEKEWISAHDARTRHSHILADGTLIGYDALFQVQNPKGVVDMMEGPGDPRASIGNLANCRCSMALKAKRNEQGRLIPKQNFSIAA